MLLAIDLMETEVVIVRDNDTIEKALRIMNNKKINGAPVVNQMGQLVGMVVKADIYRFLIDPGHYETCPVEWVMSKDVICVEVNDTIIDVANTLRENNIIAAPVNDGDNLMGIITIEDIVDYFKDEYIKKIL